MTHVFRVILSSFSGVIDMSSKAELERQIDQQIQAGNITDSTIDATQKSDGTDEGGSQGIATGDISGSTITFNQETTTIGNQTINQGEKQRNWTIPVVVGLLLALVITIATVVALLPQPERDNLLFSVGMISASLTPSPIATATLTPQRATSTPPRAPSTPRITAQQNIAIRNGPGASFDRIAVLNAGDHLDILGISEDDRWYQVLLPDGNTGWVVSASSAGEVSGPIAAIAVIVSTTTSTPSASASPTTTVSPTPTPPSTSNIYSVRCGDIIENEFLSTQDSHVYQITLQAGDSFSIGVVSIGASLTTDLAIRAPNGEAIAELTNSSSPNLESGTLSTSGKSDAVITSNGAGVYTLFVACTLRDGAVIEPGDPGYTVNLTPDIEDTLTPTNTPTLTPTPIQVASVPLVVRSLSGNEIGNGNLRVYGPYSVDFPETFRIELKLTFDNYYITPTPFGSTLSISGGVT